MMNCKSTRGNFDVNHQLGQEVYQQILESNYKVYSQNLWLFLIIAVSGFLIII